MSNLSKEYKKLVKYILDNGISQNGRNGNVLIIPFYSFTLDFSNPENAKLKLRKIYTKGIEGEFKTLISKEPLTNVKQFEKNGCNYWKAWAKEDGSLNLDYYNELHPALENIIKQIKENPNSRRHVISLWNNDHVFNNSLSLPCCWHNLTFSVIKDILYLTWTQRSVDTMVGLVSDIYLAYLFMDYVAKQCNLKIGKCMFALSNVHIYKEHIDGAKEILKRTEKDFNKPLKFLLKE